MEKLGIEAGMQGEMPPGMMEAMSEQTPELKEWFKSNPTVESALELPLDKKKEFILMYYSEDINSDELLEKMLEEAEKIVDKEI